ncbi:YdeI/OmpD-associated family protein [candidate division WWE3 bacterium]|uniref:YdeI/OmpD-associated family protein n=1 Tax=candidate division WWE3 bacterium TaxID=2053526 RepID=A0A955J233_UNCKA|nr:YdeI/OmpD-associated family protein [candidate division WWE3 bacterium]
MFKKVASGVVHKVPADLREMLVADIKVLDAWQNITPLARNEWLCWVESAKKSETREKRIKRVANDLLNGKKRPCCWPGCTHR